MFVLHQLHHVDEDKITEFEAAVREGVLPAQSDAPARLLWYARGLPESFGGSEVVTMTFIDSPEGLLTVGSDTGDALGQAYAQMRALRRGVESRLCRYLTFCPLRDALAAEESVPEGAALYLHDFVTPQLGRFDEYDHELNVWYRELAKLEGGTASSVWAGLQVVPGGGVARECVIISRVADRRRFMVPIVHGLPEHLPGPLGEWMRVAKSLRDTWTSRLVVAPEWSPLR